MDTSLLHALNGFAWHHDAFEDLLGVYAGASQMLFMALLVVLVIGTGERGGGWGRRAAVAGGLAAGLALAGAQILSRVVDRPRPFVADPAGVHLFVAHAADASFPSDHATAAFAIATALLLRNRAWGAAVTALAVLLAVGRVALGVHYPSDVIAGAALGAAAALALHAPAARRHVERLADGIGRAVDATRAFLIRRS